MSWTNLGVRLARSRYHVLRVSFSDHWYQLWFTCWTSGCRSWKPVGHGWVLSWCLSKSGLLASEQNDLQIVLPFVPQRIQGCVSKLLTRVSHLGLVCPQRHSWQHHWCCSSRANGCPIPGFGLSHLKWTETQLICWSQSSWAWCQRFYMRCSSSPENGWWTGWSP